MHVESMLLDIAAANLPEIRQALGQERWSLFAERLRGQAASFQNITSEEDLSHAVEELMVLFDETPGLTSDGLSDPRLHPNHETTPPDSIKLDTIANKFYLLCQHPELVAAGVALNEIANQSAWQDASARSGTYPPVAPGASL